MNRLAQVGIICVILGGMTLFLGLFPFAADIDATPGFGPAQIFAILSGLVVLIVGAYVVVFSVIGQNRPYRLIHGVGIRLGLTGLVIAASATLADVMGFGSHTTAAMTFGWLQEVGLLFGFLVAASGVIVYAMAR
jgi:hypothetical protein